MSEEPAELRRFALPADERGRPREALVIRSVYAEPVAYLNLCPHLDVPLDAGSPDFAPRRGHLMCRTHGARFRTLDGQCVWGPCQGESLQRLELERTEGGRWLLFEGARLRVD